MSNSDSNQKCKCADDQPLGYGVINEVAKGMVGRAVSAVATHDDSNTAAESAADRTEILGDAVEGLLSDLL